MNEAETRAEYIDPSLKEAGWGVVEASRIRREYPITPGRIEGHGRRGKGLTADYVLEFRNTKLAVVEAKAWDVELTEGVAQAKNYAAKLAVRFAFAGNGQGIYRIDMQTGEEGEVDRNILANQAYNAFSALPEDALVRIKPEDIRKKGKVPKNGSLFFTIFQTFMSGPQVDGKPSPILASILRTFLISSSSTNVIAAAPTMRATGAASWSIFRPPYSWVLPQRPNARRMQTPIAISASRCLSIRSRTASTTDSSRPSR